MKTLLLTNEYPPTIYGGAGVHVDYLSRGLARFIDVEVRAFGDQDVPVGNPTVKGFGLDASGFTCPKSLRSAFGAIRRCTDFNTVNIDADIVHCHTWYAHFGGILAKLNYGIPLVITVHSLEPLRPWKREQLGAGYDFSCWLEKTALEMADAVIAVSKETQADILRLFDIPEERVPISRNTGQPIRTPNSTGMGWISRSPTSFSSDASRGRKASFISSTPSSISIRVSRSCFAPARRTRRRSQGK
jgi:glycosyltransferase involved in cell wall biosynthesis